MDTFWVANHDGSCESALTMLIVTVDTVPAQPSISAGGPTTFCQGGSVTLTASAGSSYLWSNASVAASIQVSTSGTYTVQTISAEGCSSPASAASPIWQARMPFAAPSDGASVL